MPAAPAYIWVADKVIADVGSKRYHAGDKLPSVVELCQRYNVSASTIQLVFVRLEALEVIHRHQGKGVFVTDPKTWLRKP